MLRKRTYQTTPGNGRDAQPALRVPDRGQGGSSPLLKVLHNQREIISSENQVRHSVSISERSFGSIMIDPKLRSEMLTEWRTWFSEEMISR